MSPGMTGPGSRHERTFEGWAALRQDRRLSRRHLTKTKQTQ